MELGIQLYGLSPICRKQPEQFFQNLKEMGYHLAEPCLIVGTPDGSEPSGFWQPTEIPTYMSCLENTGLHAISCHVLIKTERQDIILETLRMLNQQYGIHHFVFGCPALLSKDVYASYAGMLHSLAVNVQAFNAEILLHNGPDEIRTKFDGITAYEWLLNACKGLVFAQPDVGWILYGGEDPVAILERNKSRIHSLHYKDIKRNYKDLPAERCDTGIGMGCLDIKSCFRFVKTKGIPHIIDQDRSDGNIMEDLSYAQNLLFGFDLEQ